MLPTIGSHGFARRYLGGRDLSELVELSGFTEYPAEIYKPRESTVMEYIWGPPPDDENV